MIEAADAEFVQLVRWWLAKGAGMCLLAAGTFGAFSSHKRDRKERFDVFLFCIGSQAIGLSSVLGGIDSFASHVDVLRSWLYVASGLALLGSVWPQQK